MQHADYAKNRSRLMLCVLRTHKKVYLEYFPIHNPTSLTSSSQVQVPI